MLQNYLPATEKKEKRAEQENCLVTRALQNPPLCSSTEGTLSISWEPSSGYVQFLYGPGSSYLYTDYTNPDQDSTVLIFQRSRSNYNGTITGNPKGTDPGPEQVPAPVRHKCQLFRMHSKWYPVPFKGKLNTRFFFRWIQFRSRWRRISSRTSQDRSVG
jgi:hypothetical protein